MYLGVAVSAISAWTFFVLWAMSAEKAASSGEVEPWSSGNKRLKMLIVDIHSFTVVRTLNFNLRSSPVVKAALGEGVKPKPFILGHEPWVHGKVSL